MPAGWVTRWRVRAGYPLAPLYLFFAAPTPRAIAIGAAIAVIPANAAVSAQNRIGGHLSARRTVYLYPYIGAARYVVLDKHGIGYLGLNEPPPEKRLFAVAQALLSSPRFRLIFNRGGVLVYERVD